MIAIFVNSSLQHQRTAASALLAGFVKSGDAAAIVENDVGVPPLENIDAVVLWGWRRGPVFRARGLPVLVAERGYLGDREKWISLSWNGLDGRGLGPARDDPARFRENFGHLLHPWRRRSVKGWAVVMGQRELDAAVKGVDFLAWAGLTLSTLRSAGWDARYRPHPGEREPRIPEGAQLAPKGELVDVFRGASVVVTFNSNSAVDAVLAGVPTVAVDEGSMAFPVASHSVSVPPITPDRAEWAARLAWRQWTLEELESGEAWRAMKEVWPRGDDGK